MTTKNCQKQLEQAWKRGDQFIEENNKLKGEIDRLTSRIAVLTDERNDLDIRLAAAQGAYEAVVKKCKGSMSMDRVAQASLARADEARTALLHKIEALEQKLHDTSNAHDFDKTRLDGLRHDRDYFKKLAEDTKDANIKLKARLDRLAKPKTSAVKPELPKAEG